MRSVRRASGLVQTPQCSATAGSVRNHPQAERCFADRYDGAGALTAVRRAAEANAGTVKLLNLPPRIFDLLPLTKLITLFEVFRLGGGGGEQFHARCRITGILDDFFLSCSYRTLTNPSPLANRSRTISGRPGPYIGTR